MTVRKLPKIPVPHTFTRGVDPKVCVKQVRRGPGTLVRCGQPLISRWHRAYPCAQDECSAVLQSIDERFRHTEIHHA